MTGTAINWADGNSDVKTINIALTDDNGDTNKAFQFQLDLDTNLAVAPNTIDPEVDDSIQDWGAFGTACLCYIGGSQAATATGFQQESDGINDILCVDTEDVNSTLVAGPTADEWGFNALAGFRNDAYMKASC